MLHWISNYSLIRSTSCSCSTCCFGLGFQPQNLHDFTKISRALIKDIFLSSFGEVVGVRCPCSSGAGVASVGARHRLQGARSGGLALRAVGVVGGRPPRGGASCLREGRLGLGAPPPPAVRSLGRQSGSAAQWLWVRVCGCGDPALAPWLACPSGRSAPWGWQEGFPGGVGLLLSPFSKEKVIVKHATFLKTIFFTCMMLTFLVLNKHLPK